MNDVTIRQGMSASESPLPMPELAPGNIVRLKKPYRVEGQELQFGIIAEQIGWNAFGVPQVSLHLYGADWRLYVPVPPIPGYVDFCASEFTLLRVARANGYTQLNGGAGHDLYPTCPVCGGNTKNAFHTKACKACGGWGHVRPMVRLNQGK